MSPGRYVSLAVLLALLLILGATFYQFVAPFLLPLFLAAVLAIVCQPLHRWALDRCGGRTAIAAGVTTVVLVCAVVVPVLVGTVLAAVQLIEFAQTYFSENTLRTSDLWTRLVLPAIDAVAGWIPGTDPDALRTELEANLQALPKRLAGTTLSLASSTVGALVSLTVAVGMFLVALYYFLADGPQLLAAAERLIPLQIAHQRQLWAEFTKATRAVVMATFFAAFAQGIATALALQVLGFGHFLVFLAAATVTALIPIAGTWMVWGPCAVWLAIQGHWGSAIGLTIWGSVVVGLLDNVVRTYVLNSDAELHPLLAFVSVIGALQALGLWGIFIGPIVACCLSGLVKIFNRELNDVLLQRSAEQKPPAGASTSPTPTPPLAAEAPPQPDGAAATPVAPTAG
jgi:predicted PurR-regulated permease PerM